MAGRSLIGFIQNFGGGEILVILLAALVILGPDRLPEVGRSIGRAIHKARTMTSGVESQVRDVIDDPAMQSIRELGEFAARPRQKLAQYALEAEAEARAQAAPVEPPAAEPPAVEPPAAEALPVDPAPVTSAPEKPLDIRGD
ncbi:MAG: twin-arginine translocase TatA/TatE family subunit [Actinobacteria bacterium]|nr:twin-arginine translocase TatA/TatE family subunit [Actinomycetota bacterium]